MVNSEFSGGNEYSCRGLVVIFVCEKTKEVEVKTFQPLIISGRPLHLFEDVKLNNNLDFSETMESWIAG